eukprot:CAMPEP_0198224710 /NCGR_PEP_ID=MMETSP1445-20131203/98002_1 /TAXON_ID=36898 /ORGANISM="Pyramimonas sp., Strain CCMP2087" /LENGTH=60 /DNA_ID=CAMNT_0043903957 /DNA_START=361 /DNA_END=543 /DNA_ORIENTATION=+
MAMSCSVFRVVDFRRPQHLSGEESNDRPSAAQAMPLQQPTPELEWGRDPTMGGYTALGFV